MKTYHNDVACKFDNIIFDLDSTLVTIEGIDELARMKGVADKIIPVTRQAMNGDISLEEAFTNRLAIINPTYTEVRTLADLYLSNLVDGVRELIGWLHEHNSDVFIVSGGYDPAVTTFAAHLGIAADHVFANRLQFTPEGQYLSLKQNDYLWKEHGKTKIIAEIKTRFPGKTVIIGDGISDLEAASAADEFICFAGVARRQNVIDKVQSVVYEKDLMNIKKYLI